MSGDGSPLPLVGTHWGTYEAAAGGLRPFRRDPAPSPIGLSMLEAREHPLRVRRPVARRGWLTGDGGAGRGEDGFVAIPWDEAEARVAGELSRVIAVHGNAAVFGGSYGWASAGRVHHAQSWLRRLLNLLGGCTRSVDTYSFAAAEVVLPHLMASFYQLLDEAEPWRDVARHADLVVAFGGVPLKNSQINSGGVGRHGQGEGVAGAIAAGVRIVVLGPDRRDAPPGAEGVPLRPGTDAALMLALTHTLMVEGLADVGFLTSHCVGWERVAAHLRGEVDGTARDADWAAAICGVEVEAIRRLARDMARSRTVISASWSLSRQENGEQPFWAAVTLAAALGQVGLPGRGIAFGYGATNSIGGAHAHLDCAAVPQGRGGVDSFIPVARIADMLLNPDEGFDYDGGHYHYPDVRLVWWAGGNPFHHHQDLTRLRRAWRRPETVIVNDWCWTATARHADLVLPCTTPLEREDLVASPRDGFVVRSERVAEPVGEARDDFAILAGIARRMGVGEAFTEGLDAEGWRRRLYEETRERSAARGFRLPPYEEFLDKRVVEVGERAEGDTLLARFRADPVANPLPTPSGRIELASERVASFGIAECPGHAHWTPPREWLGARGPFPLHLISNQPSGRLHSQLDFAGASLAAKRGGREPLRMSPADAAARGIEAGDVVRVWNARGAFLASAQPDPDLMPGVMQVATGAWLDAEAQADGTLLCRHGNPNTVTRDAGTSRLAQGPIAQSCLVEVERWAGEAPKVRAFEPPEVVEGAG